MGRILVAAEAAERDLLCQAFRGTPYRVLQAGTLQDAWDVLRDDAPDAALLALHPLETSLTLLRAIRARHVLASTWVTVVLADPRDEDRVRRAGADTPLVQPVTYEQVRADIGLPARG